MCGIVGMYTYNRDDLQYDYFKWCLQTMKHRGPDAEGFWDNKQNYITGFARLAIRDLSEMGNQPMLSECGDFCISFNGEIYNTDVLIALLKPYRTHFSSECDTEVLLYALIHLGAKETLKIADGMFAFAFYDLKKNSLLLARDRVGIKPLYIGTGKDGIVYSSQYDHIINHSYLRNESFDMNAVASYLYLGFMSDNSGVITNTKMLPHGYFALVENGKVMLHQYYKYEVTTNSTNEKNMEKILENSVSDQLVSDVPLGTFMSGGTDSTLVSYFANKRMHVKSFTMGIEDSEMDESKAAKAYAEKFNIINYCKQISSFDLVNLINENTKAFSEPFADFSSLPSLMLSKFAKEQVTVALSGDGSDELFWGYSRSRKMLALIPFYKKNLWERRLRLLISKVKDRRAIDLARHWNTKNFIQYYYYSLAITGAPVWIPQVFKASAACAFFLNAICEENNEEITEDVGLMNLIRKMEVDIHLQRMLIKVDRASMYHSLEVRVPFLSNSMLANSLLVSYKDCIEGQNGKMNIKRLLMQKAASDLVYAPKKGFMIPMDEWIRKEIKTEILEKIMDMPAHLSYMFNRDKLQSLLNKHMNDSQNLGWFIWAIFSFVQWDEYHRNKFLN